MIPQYDGLPCELWTGNVDEGGYGYYSRQMPEYGTRRAHRIACIQAYGPPPDGSNTFACHTCDNPPCIRPSHLFWGTNSINQKDSLAKGRWTSPTQKLSYEQCVEIAARWIPGAGGNTMALAAEYGVDRHTIRLAAIKRAKEAV